MAHEHMWVHMLGEGHWGLCLIALESLTELDW